MSLPRLLTSLRVVLIADAITCAVMGMLLLLGSGLIGGLTGIPAPLLFYAGAILLPIAAFMIIVAIPAATPVAGAWIVVIGNVLWTAASVLLPVSGLIAPNGLGWAFLLAQAAAVAVLARLEYGALARRPLVTFGAL